MEMVMHAMKGCNQELKQTDEELRARDLNNMFNSATHLL